MFPVLRDLWERRWLVVAGVGVALLAAGFTAYRVDPGLPPKLESRKYEVGLASAAVLIDSPTSQAVAVTRGRSATDVATLATRARLLASLMTTSPLKERIAARARLGSTSLIARASFQEMDPGPLPPEEEVEDRWAHILTTHVGETLPIITASTQAPDPEVAARIASAAATELSAYLSSTALAESVPDARQLRADTLGPAQAVAVERGPRRLYAVGAFVLVVALWCGGIALALGLARGWRELSALESPTVRS